MNVDAARVHKYLIENGASSVMKIGRETNLLPHRVEGALSILSAIGWAEKRSSAWVAKPR